MIRICGERISSRLSRRLHSNTTILYSVEKKDLFSKWTQRAYKRLQKIVFCFTAHSVSLKISSPFPLKDTQISMERESSVHRTYENVIYLIRAVFTLFVSIFYQSSEEPAFCLKARCQIGDERRGVFASLLSSLLFLGLYQEVVRCLQNRFFVMEKSYV